jgi:hypothetical protein
MKTWMRGFPGVGAGPRGSMKLGDEKGIQFVFERIKHALVKK